MILQDAVKIDGSSRKYTDEGFLEATAVICRTGVQEYYGSELPGLGLDNNKKYKIYRPESEVFAQAAMDSFKRRPITNEHPYDVGGLLSTETAQQKTVGTSGSDIRRVGDTLVVDVTIWDSTAIKDIENGKTGLSNGYTLDIEMTPGTSPTGEKYHGIQKNIRGNHIAVCANDAARGGLQCRLLDEKKKRLKDMKQETPDLENMNQIGQLIQDLGTEVAALKQMVVQLSGAKPEEDPADPSEGDGGDAIAEDEKDNLMATDTMKELERLRGQLDAYKATDMNKIISDKVNSRVNLLDKARKVIPDIDNSLSDLEIQKLVIKKTKPSLSLDQKNAEYISGLFDAAIDNFVDGANSAHALANAIKTSRVLGAKEQEIQTALDNGSYLDQVYADRNKRNRELYKTGGAK